MELLASEWEKKAFVLLKGTDNEKLTNEDPLFLKTILSETSLCLILQNIIKK